MGNLNSNLNNLHSNSNLNKLQLHEKFLTDLKTLCMACMFTCNLCKNLQNQLIN